jgi:perosamine synthetase
MGNGLTNEIIQKMQRMFTNQSAFLALHEPKFRGNEWAYVKECLDTGWVSSAGKYVERFEEDLAATTGSPYAVAVVNGTAALHICLLLAGVKEGDEVIIPSLTFVATANAVSYCRAYPHFADVSTETMGIDPGKLEDYLRDTTVRKTDGYIYNRKNNRRIAAVVPMHTFGHSVDLDPLMELCERYNLPLVEDAAESLGSYYRGKHTGTFGQTAAMSFNGNKIITTGGGGAILTSDEKLAKTAKHLTTTAKIPHRWEFYHDITGYNYRMPNLNAALGCAQLENLSDIIDQKRKLADRYQEIFSNTEGISVFKEPKFSKSNYWLNAIILDPTNIHRRDEILEQTNKAGIMTRPIWTAMHRLPMYEGYSKMDLSVTELLEKSVVNIPSSPFLNSTIRLEG